jgi:hypothetical protein
LTGIRTDVAEVAEGDVIQLLRPLEHRGDALAAADAHGGERNEDFGVRQFDLE